MKKGDRLVTLCLKVIKLKTDQSATSCGKTDRNAQLKPLEFLRHHNERAVLPREILIQNRSVFVINLFLPCHMHYLLFVVVYTISQKSGEVQRE